MELILVRVLLAEDNRVLSAWLARLLRKENYVVDCVYDGEEADVALLYASICPRHSRLGLPRLDGIGVLRRFRVRHTATPVLILTANDAISSRVKELHSGADDYLIMPIDVPEFEAHIRAQLWRGQNNKTPCVTYGPLTHDTATREFPLQGGAVVAHAEGTCGIGGDNFKGRRPIQKTSLAASTFGFDDDADPNAIEIYVHRVRKKLEGHHIAAHDGSIGISDRGEGPWARPNGGGPAADAEPD